MAAELLMGQEGYLGFRFNHLLQSLVRCVQTILQRFFHGFFDPNFVL
jgi:hypothetical protein